MDFVRRQESHVLPAMGAIAATGTPSGAAEFLGTTEHDFSRMHTRLRQLGSCFVDGEEVPQQRSPLVGSILSITCDQFTATCCTTAARAILASN